MHKGYGSCLVCESVCLCVEIDRTPFPCRLCSVGGHHRTSVTNAVMHSKSRLMRHQFMRDQILQVLSEKVTIFSGWHLGMRLMFEQLCYGISTKNKSTMHSLQGIGGDL